MYNKESKRHKALYMDNFLSRPDLCGDLHTRAINCCANVRQYHTRMLRDFAEKTPKSNTNGRVKGKIVSVSWKNEQHMYMFTTSVMNTGNLEHLSPLKTTVDTVSMSITVTE
jgi:hypothetical protein